MAYNVCFKKSQPRTGHTRTNRETNTRTTVIRTDPQSCLNEMLEYREKYAGNAPGNAMDMEAYYDNYDPDRAYHDAVAKPEEWYTSALAAFGIGSDD